ncbi:AAA family ATPase [Amorphus orientalis]|uniref:MobA/VirD2-like nuclease domain-containing protein n=1 Tax=Amorphus orientalis TaxID=649198 RepID=A0AAE3VMW9_9HYPH|nr:AAA family ATPase [Amorphus orientalis]MDQ0314887.1 hypothetical protein [Amorphus orientalis]
MVIKGRSRSGAKELAAHLLRTDTNERMEVLELRGTVATDLLGALREFEAVAVGTRCKRSLYHASINVPVHERLDGDGWDLAIDRLEAELGLTGQARAVVMHEKLGREHVHIVWSRIDLARMTAIADSHTYRKHEIVARELERTLGHARVQGVHVERDGQLRPERTPSHAEMQLKERTGSDPVRVKHDLTRCWRETETGAEFAAALEASGYVLARGNRRSFVAVDAAGVIHSLPRRIEGARARDVAERLGTIGELPNATDVRASRMADLDRSQHAEAARAAVRDPRDVLEGLLVTRPYVHVHELESALGEAGHADPEQALEALCTQKDILQLREPESDSVLGITTQAVRDQERRLLARATRLAASDRHAVDPRFIGTAIRERTLDPEQADALRHALDAGSLKIIEGRAGTGKSHTLNAIRSAAERDGHTVIGLAPTNAVAQDLRDSGFGRATTVHSLLWYREHAPDHDAAHVPRRSLLIVDEAAMLDTERLDRMTALAEEAGAKLLLVGDDRQLASIERGGMFSVIRDAIGSTTLTTVRRQTRDWAREAARDFAEGRFAEALAAYQDHDLIDWSATLETARQHLIDRWAADTAEARGKRFVFAYTNEEVRRLNDALQAIEIERDRVTDLITLETERGTLHVGVGDRIAFRGTDKPRGIHAGALGTVEAIRGDVLTVRSDRGRRIDVDTTAFTNLDLGYAGTIYRGQGKTLDQVYLLHTRHWRDAASYVAMTRSRNETRVFVARDQAKNLTDLAHQMARQNNRGATLALEVTGERGREQLREREIRDRGRER